MSAPLIHSSGNLGHPLQHFRRRDRGVDLVLDFDFIETGVERGATEVHEWYGAFGRLVDAGVAYLEILRCYAKMQSRRH